jgi:hypothetical protein
MHDFSTKTQLTTQSSDILIRTPLAIVKTILVHQLEGWSQEKTYQEGEAKAAL